MPKTKFMKIAIREALKGIKRSEGGPFGAVIVKNGKVVASAHNRVLCDKNPTCHAEINAITIASRALKSHDLSGCRIYSTTEPCPMCFSAIHWARIDEVIYGTNISDVRKLGFNELVIPAKKMKRSGKSQVGITSGFMVRKCRELLKCWSALETKRTY